MEIAIELTQIFRPVKMSVFFTKVILLIVGINHFMKKIHTSNILFAQSTSVCTELRIREGIQ